MKWEVNVGSNSESGSARISSIREAFSREIVGHSEAVRRLLEWAAVRVRFGGHEASYPALTGPFGSGRTALAQALANGLGLPLLRIELAELTAPDLRGVPRTDGGERGVLRNRLGSEPEAVVLLDGLDRLDGGRAALVLRTLLDPDERFRDRFDGEEVSLARAFVIVTAEHPDRIPAVLRPLVVPIRLVGYDSAEKRAICEQHLIPRALSALGAAGAAVSLTPDAVEQLCSLYAPEAGVRGLRRRVRDVLRRAVARLALGETDAVSVDLADLEVLLGPPPPRFARQRGDVGTALGLVWGRAGGEIALVEALLESQGGAHLGPQAGVRPEALESAVAFLREHADGLGIEGDRVGRANLAVRATLPPRAGGSPATLDLAVLLALTSVATDRPVRAKLAAVGSVTLRGSIRSLPGLPEMVLGAVRAGISTVLVPQAGLEEVTRTLPLSTRSRIELKPVADARSATREALTDIVIARGAFGT